MRDYFQQKPCTSDIDVFFASPEDLAEGIRSLEETDARLIYSRKNVQGYIFKRRKIELIKNRFFPGPEETIDEFDFTVCCAAINHWGRVVVHPNFFEDLAANRLVIHQLDYPLGTLARLPRYVEKGFKPCNGTLLRLAKAIQSIDFDDPEQNKLEFYSSGKQRFGRFEDNEQFELSTQARMALAQLEVVA